MIVEKLGFLEFHFSESVKVTRASRVRTAQISREGVSPTGIAGHGETNRTGRRDSLHLGKATGGIPHGGPVCGRC